MPPTYIVDAFAEAPFAGNPAAVCLLTEAAGEGWMQSVAAEMNLSETAFLLPHEAGFDLRWFTPGCEVDLCGHATLASAHVLWQTGMLQASEEARFHTRSGVLTCRRGDDLIEMDFPAKPAAAADPPSGLLEALRVAPRWVGRSQWDWLVEVAGESAVRAVAPDMTALARVDARGVVVTARSAEPRFDFVSRFFAPAAGVPEDPVTGSAHCVLAPYWSGKLGRHELVGHQVSRRGGVVRVRHEGERVVLGGRAVTVLRGDLVTDLV